MRKSLIVLIAVLLLGAFAGLSARAAFAADDDTVKKVPRFATLNKDEIFVRTGPALQYPIRWVYRKRGLPVEIIRDYDTWRQIRDFDGSVGWVHHAMLSGYRSAIVKQPEGATVTSRPDANAGVVVRLDKGVIVSLEKCKDAWCDVRISGFRGWLPRTSLWGIYPDEQID